MKTFNVQKDWLPWTTESFHQLLYNKNFAKILHHLFLPPVRWANQLIARNETGCEIINGLKSLEWIFIIINANNAQSLAGVSST